ncbi:HlyD family secretion protein [Candidatus Litorirhabdus singularis]|nr:HlyD family secretion protein [Candidatus Litorirhabdus singularis]
MNQIAEDTATSDTLPESRRRRQLLLPLLVLALAAIGYWLWERSTHVYTDDARISTDLVVISSKVSGRVEALVVKEGSSLQKGDLVAQLDARETALKVEELKAQLQATEASIAQGNAEIAMVGRQTGGALQAAESRLTAARANLASNASDLELQTAEWERAQSLRERGILSQQGWEQARSAFQVAQQGQNSAGAQVASAEAGLVEARAARERLAVLEQNQLRLRFDRDRTQHQLSGQMVAVDERRITSPIEGIVDKTFVNAGEYVMPGQRLALVHNPEQVWVKANVKETQVRHLQLGQRVKISVDAWPDESFEGELVRIGNAATSQFSLLPSTNPSGNFTKVTQRLPIKVAVQQRERMLKPGMMVEIAIDIR